MTYTFIEIFRSSAFKKTIFVIACIVFLISIILVYLSSFLMNRNPKISDRIFTVANILFWLSVIFVFLSAEKIN